MSRVIRGGPGGPVEPSSAGATPAPRVVPGEVYDARGEAARIVEAAERQAAEIRATAERDGARIREEARRGGLESARAEVAALLLRASEAHDRLLAGAEKELATLAIAAAKRIVGEELAAAPERIGHVVSDVLARARRARNVRVRVHPDDVAALRKMHPNAAVEGDPAITRGGCVVETDLGELDARLEVQLGALARALGCDPP